MTTTFQSCGKPMTSSSRFLVRALTAALAWLPLAAQAQSVPVTGASQFNQTITTASYVYDPVTGLVTSSTAMPDDASACVGTDVSQKDAYGNVTSATVSNCSSATGAAVFASRVSGMLYQSQTITINGTPVTVPAGLFTTQVTDALNHVSTSQTDPRTGTAVAVTVGKANASDPGLTTTWQLDDFGRPVKETHADGTTVSMLYCLLPGAGRNTSSNTAGCAAPSDAPTDAASYVQSQSFDSSGAIAGPFIRLYRDRLGRTIRSVTQAFDGASQPVPGALIVQDTGYNAYGAAVIATAPYFLTSISSTTAGSSDVGVTKLTYDALGRVTESDRADPHGQAGSLTYGSYGSRTSAKTVIVYQGLVTITTDDNGKKRTEERNVIGQVVGKRGRSEIKMSRI